MSAASGSGSPGRRPPAQEGHHDQGQAQSPTSFDAHMTPTSEAWSVAELSGELDEGNETVRPGASPHRGGAPASGTLQQHTGTIGTRAPGSATSSASTTGSNTPAQPSPESERDQASLLVAQPEAARRKPRTSSTAGIFDLDADDIGEASGSAASASASAQPSLSAHSSPISASGATPRAPLDTLRRVPGSTSQRPGYHSATPTPISTNLLSIPAPVHTAGTSPGSGKHLRGPFDTMPPFSSPLAYATTLPTESPDDIDIDASPASNDEEELATEIRTYDSNSTSRSDASSKTSSPVHEKTPKSSSQRQFQHPSTSSPNFERRAYMGRKSLTENTPGRRLAARMSAGETSAAGAGYGSPVLGPATSGRKSASSNMGPPLTIPRKSAGHLSAGSSTSSSSARMPEGSEASNQVRALLSRARSTTQGRSTSGASEDGTASIRSASGSSISSTSGAASGPMSPTFPSSTMSASPSTDTAPKPVPVSRLRAGSNASPASAHRRARSLGGALLGAGEVASSPIGGPDGVDPDLVAAIEAGDAEIPGRLGTHENTMSRSPVNEHHRKSMSVSKSAASRIASLPSTPSATVRGLAGAAAVAPQRARQHREMLHVATDPNLLGTSYDASPSAASEGEDEMGESFSGFVRQRVRSQTMASPQMGRARLASGPPTASRGSGHDTRLGSRSMQMSSSMQHGLGIGMDAEVDESAVVASTPTSAYSSPRALRPADVEREAHEHGRAQSLSVHIPNVASRDVHNMPVSALPAVTYSPEHSPRVWTRPAPPSAWNAREARQHGRLSTGAASEIDSSVDYTKTRRQSMDPTYALRLGSNAESATSTYDDTSSASAAATEPTTDALAAARFATPSRTGVRGGRDASARRLSLVHAPQGIDEYAQIIVQSRNAKLQKWRTGTRGQQDAPADIDSARLALQRMSLADEAGSSTARRLPPAATPNVSPTVSPAGSRRASLGSSSDQEIEWVDWLDEYSKMKEMKLQASRQGEADPQSESAGQGRQDDTSALQRPTLDRNSSSQDDTKHIGKARSSSSVTEAAPTPGAASPVRINKSRSSIGLDNRRTGSLRRPSQFSRQHSATAEGTRAWSGGMLLSEDGGSSHSQGSRASPTRKGSGSDRSRHASLSPTTHRERGDSYTSASGHGGFPIGARRKKLLGGKIDAWWSAVKSGFANPPPLNPGSIMGPRQYAVGRPIGSHMGIAGPSRRIGEPWDRPDLHRGKSMAATHAPRERQAFARERSQSFQPDQSASKTLRSWSPTLNPLIPESGDVPQAQDDETKRPSQALPSIKSDRSSTDTALAMASKDQADSTQIVAGEAKEGKDSSAADGDEPHVHDKSAPGPSRRTPSLSLDLVAATVGSSGADAASSHSSPMPSTGSPRMPKLGSGGVAEESKRKLSDAWQPQLAKVASSQDVRASSPSRDEEQHEQRLARESGEASHLRSGSKDITIDSIRRHIHHRLAASKENCDREIRKTIKAINAFAEEQLQEQRKLEELDATSQALANLGLEDRDEETIPAAPRSGAGGGNDQGSSYSPAAMSRSPSRDQPPEKLHGALTTGEGDAEDLLSVPTPRQANKMGGEYRLPPPPHRPSVGLSRRFSQSGRRDRSREVTSTSTSRSHSPLPPLSAQSADSPHYSPARRTRPLVADDMPIEPFILPLQGLVGIAMDVLDTSIDALTQRSEICQEIIASIQELGKAWENNPTWPGRGFYVKLLLSVASLSRIVEWWEAEKGFWNFEADGEGQGHEQEPLRFIVGNQGNLGTIRDDNGGHSPQNGAVIARQLASSSPVRLVRLGAHTSASATPSQQSSAANSPALEPLDRRGSATQNVSRVPERWQADVQANEEADEEELEEPEALEMGPAKDGAEPEKTPASVEDSQNVLMELDLDGERFLYLSPAWWTVVGLEPTALFGHSIADLLAPSNINIFAEATKALQSDESHTVEAVFNLRVEPTLVNEPEADAIYFQEMEGKGMLMHDRATGAPSHTMWVFKPTGPPIKEAELLPSQQRITSASADNFGAVPESAGGMLSGKEIILSVEPILCRICERDVPAWFFEKHSEICNEIHRLEMEITESNESLAELRQTVRDITTGLEEKSSEAVEYNGVTLTTPPASMEPPSALEGATKSLALRQANPAAVRKAHLRALNAIIDILRVAGTISTPATKDNAESIEKQRLLSPDSESKVTQVRSWKLPLLPLEDEAFELLSSDVEAALRRKLSAVNRMLNTIVYVETVRMEWEQRVNAALADEDEQESVDSENQTVSSGKGTNEAEEASVKAAENTAALPSALVTPAVAEQEEDEDEGPSMLLEANDDGLAAPTSTALSAQGEAGEDEDVPGVEGAMGGNAFIDAIPIPSRATSRIQRMRRGSSVVSSSSGENLVQTHALKAAPVAGRRQSVVGGDRRVGHTPPLSPSEFAFSPASLTKSRDRRTSNALRTSLGGPLSPRLPPAAPSSRATTSTIKDFDIIKPISKGAFGSVFLAKKRTTGDYYAIKVLKKSDMIAKNQITNVKAERMILMTQTQSPFVVKLFFTFQSSENLYLVMEYLPGGDLANLVKVLGGLPEPWAKQFLAEVVNGLEMLHARGVVHRDMKPDNLLIDQKGHLKLTDFGLSKIGLLGRQSHQQQTRGRASAGQQGQDTASRDSTHSASSTGSSPSPFGGQSSVVGRPNPETPGTAMLAAQPFYVGTPTHPRGRIMSASLDVNEVNKLDSFLAQPQRSPAETPTESPRNAFGSHMQSGGGAGSGGAQGSGGSGGQLKRFVGTPDYLAPESILGLGMDDAAVDWWAVGVILFEFIYGYPPFHAETPEKVFDNILSRNINWEEGADIECSDEARDLMNCLMCTNRKDRLGANGADEIKKHPFFADIDWEHLTESEGPFVPQITDPESTDYFDLRGAVYQDLHQEDAAPSTQGFANALAGNSRIIRPSRPPTRNRIRSDKFVKDLTEGAADEFGAFSYKNLPVLKQANDEVVKKMRGDQLGSMSAVMMEQQQSSPASQHNIPAARVPLPATPATTMQQAIAHQRHRSISGAPASQRSSAIFFANAGPPSPSTSISSMSSAPSKSTAPTSPSAIQITTAGGLAYAAANQPSRRRQSDLTSGPSAGTTGSPSGSSSGNNPLSSYMDRKRSQISHEDDLRRNISAARFRATSIASDVTGSDSATSSSPWSQQPMIKPVAESTEPTSAAKEDESVPSPINLAAAPETSKEAATDSPSNHREGLSCMVAEINPIAQHMLSSILHKLGCHVVVVRNGGEALRMAMGEEAFAMIFLGTSLPIVNGQDVARMIRSTRNKNAATPIVALTRHEEAPPQSDGGSSVDPLESLLQNAGGVFDGVLTKPIDRVDVCALLPRLGFQAFPASELGAALAPLHSPIDTRRGSGGRRSIVAQVDEVAE